MRGKGRIDRSERGVTLVLVAISLVAILAMVAVVLDGGDAYATRRKMQNAADAASLAATRALDRARFRGGDPLDVDRTARSVAISNGGSSASDLYDCKVVDKNHAVIAACSATDTVTGWRAPANFVRATGVSVRAGTVRQTAFGGVVGHRSVPVRTTATASVQPLMGADGPFMVCGDETAGAQSPTAPGHGILLPAATQSPPWRINPLAVGLTFDLHGPQVADCNAQGDSFKGLAEGPFALPGWIASATGVHAGPTRSLVADAHGCTGTDLDDCILLVPVCTTARGNSASGVEMFCVHMAAFRVAETSANKHTGVLLGGITAIGGQTGTGDVSASDVRVVKLSA